MRQKDKKIAINRTEIEPLKTLDIEETDITVNTYKNTEKVVKAAASAIALEIEESMKRGRPILLMLSGGSSLNVADALAERLEPDNLDMTLLTVSVVDERVVVGGNNNFEALRETAFFKRFGSNSDINFIDTSVGSAEEGNVDQHAKKFEMALRSWKERYPEGVVLVLLGVGNDGHTSGILPFPENPALQKGERRWVVGYNLEDYSDDPAAINEHLYRSTTTPYFLQELVDQAFVFMVGDNKQEALNCIIADEGSDQITPARILRERHGKRTEIFTDLIV